MDNKIKYINEKYNKDKTEVIAYQVRIVPPKNSLLTGVDKLFSKKKFKNALAVAKDYLNTNENCQKLIMEYQIIYENNKKEWMIGCFQNLPSCKTEEPNIYKHYIKSTFGYKHKGYRLTYKKNNIVHTKVFTFSKYPNPFKSAIEFRNTDKETIENLLSRKNPKFLDYDLRIQNVLSSHNITKFPIKINKIKYIGMDIINGNYYLIKECKCCHAHINVLIYKREEGSEFCNSCSWSNLKNAKFYSLRNFMDKKGNPITAIKSMITIGKQNNKKYLIRFNIILNSKYYTKENFELAKKINILYTQYLLDDFIKKYNLKYPLLLGNEDFSKIKNKTILNYDLIKQPKTIIIDNENLKDQLLYKQQHIFKAKIQGFGTNKRNESKTVLLNEVEYVGIDNFREHMWTQFTKELDLPIGTTIKFKGEIYDYEREYLGTREVDKNGQAIKIIDLLEVDKSMRERVKLYK